MQCKYGTVRSRRWNLCVTFFVGTFRQQTWTQQCTEKRFTKFSGSVPGGSYSPPLTSQCGGAFLCLTMCYAIIVLKGFVAGSPLPVLNVASQAELSWGAQLHQPGHPQTWVVDLQVRRGVEVGARIGIGCTVSWGKDWSRLYCRLGQGLVGCTVNNVFSVQRSEERRPLIPLNRFNW